MQPFKGLVTSRDSLGKGCIRIIQRFCSYVSWSPARGKHIRLRATIVREALEDDEWRAAHLPGLFTSAEVPTKAVGPQRLTDLMREMDLYTPPMEACEDPPRPSVAAIKTPSVAIKVLIALLLLARIPPAKAEPSDIISASSLGSSILGFLGLLVSFVCLSGWVYRQFASSHSDIGSLRHNRVIVSISPVTVTMMILAVSCLCSPCLARQEEDTHIIVRHYDNLYVVGCIVTLVFAWEGLNTLVPSSSRVSSSTPKADATVQHSRVSVGSQTESIEDPQLEDQLCTRNQQARAIRALQGVIEKKNHDLQAIRNCRPTGNRSR